MFKLSFKENGTKKQKIEKIRKMVYGTMTL